MITTPYVTDKAITLAKLEDLTDNWLLGRSAGSAGVPQLLTVGTGLALSAGVLTSTITPYTDELAQDALGAMLADTATIALTYTDATPALTAAIVAGSVGTTQLTNAGVTYAKLQTVAAGRLLGDSSAVPGIVQEISVGAGLTLSGGVLAQAGGAVTGTGADQRVPIWTSPGTLAYDNAFVWDTVNHRLGIATTTPQYAL